MNNMEKRWFLVILVFIMIVYSIPVYSYLSESEKSQFEKCSLKTYANVTGDGIHSKACKEIVVEKGYDEIFLNLSCDEGKDSVVAYVNLDKNKLGGNSIKDREKKFVEAV